MTLQAVVEQFNSSMLDQSVSQQNITVNVIHGNISRARIGGELFDKKPLLNNIDCGACYNDYIRYMNDYLQNLVNMHFRAYLLILIVGAVSFIVSWMCIKHMRVSFPNNIESSRMILKLRILRLLSLIIIASALILLILRVKPA